MSQNDARTDTLSVARLYADANVTRFMDEGIDWSDLQGVQGAVLTDLLPATQIGYLRLPAGYSSDWHPAPRKQYVLVLTGTMEVEAGDGERRRFQAGSVLLVTDTEGRGHRTYTVGQQEVLLAWIPVP